MSHDRVIEYVKGFTNHLNVHIEKIWLRQAYRSQEISASERTRNHWASEREKHNSVPWWNIVIQESVLTEFRANSVSFILSLANSLSLSRFRSHRSRTIINCKKSESRTNRHNEPTAEGWYIYWLGRLIGRVSVLLFSHKQTRVFCRRRGSTAHVDGPDIDRQSRIVLWEFYRMLRAREDREECRSSSCIGALIASRFFDAGAHECTRLVKRRISKAVRRGHAAEKIPRITTGPGDASTDRTKDFFSANIIVRNDAFVAGRRRPPGWTIN